MPSEDGSRVPQPGNDTAASQSGTTTAADAGAPDARAPSDVLNRFLQPEAMVTPAALGGSVTLAAGAVASVLHLHDVGVPLLMLSFLFGIATVARAQSWTQKAVFYVINSFIILGFAAGNNAIFILAQASSNAGDAFNLQIVSPAYAASPSAGPRAELADNFFFKPFFGLGAEQQRAPAPAQPRALRSPQLATGWDVIAGSFATQEAAQQRAKTIAAGSHGKYRPTVARSAANPGIWVVYLARNTTLSEAERMRSEIRSSGLARDAYIAQP